MAWQGNQRKQRSNYFIKFFISLSFLTTSLFGKAEFVLIVGKNDFNRNFNVFGNLDSYRVYLAFKQKTNFKEVILLNEIEGNKNRNQKPSKENFLAEWSRLSNTYNKGIVYASLNGGIDKQGFPILDFGENESLSLKEILEINNFTQKKFIFIFDICKIRSNYLFEKSALEEDFQLPEIPNSFVIILSSNEEGRCYYEPKKGGSFFTNQILQILQNKNFLNIQKFSKELQSKWLQAQKHLKEEKQSQYLTWNTEQNLKILNSSLIELNFRTIEHYNNAQPFLSSILYNTEGKRYYDVYFYNLKPFSLGNLQQVKHEIDFQSIKSLFFNEKSNLTQTLGFWKTKDNEFEFWHIWEDKFAKTSFEVQENVVRKKREDLFGKNLFEDAIEFIEYKLSQGFVILKLYKNKAKVLVQNKLGISATRYNYDELGNLLQEEFFDLNKKLVEHAAEKVAKYFYEYGTSGNLEKIRKYSKKETYIKHKPPIIVQKFNDKNQILSIEYLDAEERPTQNELGIQKIEYIYEDSLLKEIQYFSDYQKLRRFGYSNIKFEYNTKNQLTQKSYYSFLKQRTFNEEKVSIYKYSYDEKDRLYSVSFFDEEEKPTLNLQEVHKIIYVYDKENKIIQEKFYDKNQNQVQNLDKPSYLLYFYDTQGKPIGIEKYNFQNQVLDAEFKLELENVLNPDCKCKLEIALDKFYRVNDINFFDSRNFVGGKE